MAYTPLVPRDHARPYVAGDPWRAAEEAERVADNLDDHETRILALVAGGGSGDVVGPASATDNAIARFDSTTGKLVQSSGITIADAATGILAGSNSGDVTLAGTPNYLTLAAQVITRALIDLAAHVTGRLPFANLAASASANRLLGRGSSGGAGDYQEISLGSGLSMSGTTLSASGGGGGAGALDDLSDVVITTPATNHVLQYDGAVFVNQPAANLSATNLTAGTVPDARFPATLPAASGVNLTALNASNLASGAVPAARMPALTGDVTTSAGAVATTVANDAVTYAKMQNVSAASKLLGRGDSGSGDPQEITLGSGLAMTGTTLSASGGGGGGMTQLAQIVTTGSQSTVDFTSISGAYSALRLVWTAQDTTAGTGSSGMHLRVNNDSTSGNYGVSGRIGSQNGASFASNISPTSGGGEIGYIPNAGNTNIAASGEVLLVGYAGTTWHKIVQARSGQDSGATNVTIINEAWRWKSTAAITRLTATTAGTAFTDGSVFTLYGLQ